MSLLPQPPTIKAWLGIAAAQLRQAGIESAGLDAELILGHTLRKPRTFLHAHPELVLSDREYEIAEARLELRCEHTPLAYIIGHKEFYGRLFRVTPATLVPRPESEAMISLLAQLLPDNLPLLNGPKLVDVGTGSGVLGITAKLEHPELDVTLVDTSRHALTVAETNARQLHADVTLIRSDLLANYPFTPDYILANLPYVDRRWHLSPELAHEPAEALFASDGSLALIVQLLDQAAQKLARSGLIFLEADTRQHSRLLTEAKTRGFKLRERRELIVCLEHV